MPVGNRVVHTEERTVLTDVASSHWDSEQQMHCTCHDFLK